jgi:RNA polymerase-binding transcription factor DksA
MNIDKYQRELLQLERALLQRLDMDMATARSASDDQASVGDLAHVDELKDEYFGLAEVDSVLLDEVRAALKRIDEGTYGQCAFDGEPIEEKRLDAVPWALYCIKHAQELEERSAARTPSL